MSDLENTDDEEPLYYRSYEITPQRFSDGWRCDVVGPEIDSVFGVTFITRDKAILHAKQKIDETTPIDFQVRVNAWMLKCFGPEISADSKERNYRFIEEALELVQALGCSREDAHKLVDYVFSIAPPVSLNRKSVELWSRWPPCVLRTGLALKKQPRLNATESGQ
jgi:hypothetical protein